jgi:hypothetical protein
MVENAASTSREPGWDGEAWPARAAPGAPRGPRQSWGAACRHGGRYPGRGRQTRSPRRCARDGRAPGSAAPAPRRVVGAGIGRLAPALDAGSQGRLARLDHEFVLGRELLVEAAAGQADSLHQLVQSDAVETVFLEEPAGALDDLAPILFGLRACDFHMPSDGFRCFMSSNEGIICQSTSNRKRQPLCRRAACRALRPARLPRGCPPRPASRCRRRALRTAGRYGPAARCRARAA